MIPRAHIDAWRAQAPWRSDAKVEQDLIICRAMAEFVENLAAKRRHPGFTADLGDLLPVVVDYNFEAGFTVVEREIVPQL